MALSDLLDAARRVLRPTPAQEVQALLQRAFQRHGLQPGGVDAAALGAGLRQLEESGRLDDPEALACLLEVADLPVVWQVLDRRGPALLAAASRFLAGRPDATGQAVAAVRGLHQRQALSCHPAELSEPVRAEVQALRTQLGTELPAASWTTPWVRRQARSRPRAIEVAPVDWPERFQHRVAPERNLQATPEEDERLRALVLRPEQGGPLLWPLMRMSEGAALRLWLEVEPAQAQVWGQELEVLIPRMGLGGLERSLALVRAHRVGLAGLRDLDSPRVAVLMAPHLTGKPAARVVARAWLARFPEAAAVGLAPVALGEEAEARDHAREALRWLHRHHGEATRRGLDRYPAPVRDALQQALAEATELPRRRPRLPPWVEAEHLPRPVLQDGTASLQGASLLELVQLLASTPLRGAPWLQPVRLAYQQPSLEALTWALFQAWLGHGANPRARWALHALAHFPTRQAVDALAALAAELAPRGRSARAQEMVEVLAAMGTRESLLAVQRLGRGVLARAFRARAELVFQAAAEAHGATEEELAERLAPDLGLTPEGWLPGVPRRRLVVRGLKVQILDEDGQPVGPPRPGVGDDVATLKREAHVVLKDGAARLRARMTLGQGMSVEHFAETYLMHPLLRALAAGVVWGAQDGDRLAFTFTVGATGPVDARGQPVPLPEGRTVVVVHPSQLTEAERAAWAARLQRQPSDPLRRLGEAARTPDELAARLAALQGREVQVATLLRLRAKGWDAAPQDGGLAPTLVRRGGAFGVVEVDFTPGLFLGNPLQYLAQRLEAVRVFLRPDAPPSLLSEVEWELSQALR